MFGGSTVRTIQTVFDAQDRGSAKLKAAEERGDELADTMEQTEQRLGAVTQAMTVTGTGAVALGGTIALLTSRFGRLDQKFQTIKTTSGATAEQMDQIRAAAKDVSTTLPVSLGQSVEATKQLSFAGLSASESMAALSETSQLAVASNLRAGQAAQTVARSLNAFQLEAQQTNAIVGALGSTFASSATNIQSLSQGLTEVQATANAAGLSVAETVGSLGLLASSGLAGSKAGTSLNAVLRRLTSGSGETQKALNELNLSMKDFTTSSGELQGIGSIMTTLSSKMQGVSSEAERIRIAQQLVGAEGARALLPLINNTDKLSRKIQNNLRAEIQGAIGDLAEMDSAELQAASNALGTDVSSQTTTTELISNLQRLSEQGESTEQITSRLRVGLGLTGDAAELLAQDISQTDKSASQLAERIGGVVTAEQLATKQTETLSGQIQQLRSDLQVIGYQMFQGTKPATMGVVGAFRTLTTPLAQNETAAKALGAGLVGLTGVLGVATVLLGAHAAQLKLATLSQAGMASQTYAGTAALWAQSAAATAASKAQWLMTASSGQLAMAIAGKTGVLAGEVTALYASTTAALSNATAMGIMTGAVGLATTAVTALWTALGPIGLLALGVTAAVIALAGVLKFDLFGAGEKAGAMLAWFGDMAGTAWAATKQLIGIIWELTRIGATLTGLALVAPFVALLELPGVIRSAIPKAKAAAAELPGQIIAGLNSMGPAKYLLPVIGPVLAIRDGIDRFGPQLKQAAMNLPANIVAGLNSLGPAKYFLPLLGPLLLAKDIITNPNKWREAGAQIPTMIANGIKSAAGDPVGAVKGLVGDVRGYLPFSPAKRGPLQDIDKTGPALVSTIAEGVESNQGQLTSALQATLGATPLGMAGGAALDVASDAAQSVGGGGKRIEISVNNEIVLEGEAGDVAAEVERAAQSGTTTAFEEFLRRISRELNGGVGAQQ